MSIEDLIRARLAYDPEFLEAMRHEGIEGWDDEISVEAAAEMLGMSSEAVRQRLDVQADSCKLRHVTALKESEGER